MNPVHHCVGAILLSALVFFGLPLPCAAQTGDSAGTRRAMSTDRPDQTESPVTVEAGRFQAEVDIASAAYDRDGGGLSSTTSGFGGFNVKAGLLDNVDLQVVLDTYQRVRIEDRGSGEASASSGIGELQTRVKFNIWGNDGGRTAFALMPFVKWALPASGLRNGRTEGGLIVPFAVELGRGVGLGAMTELDFVDDGEDGYDFVSFNTVTVGRDLWGPLGGYAEFAAALGAGPWVGQFDAGVTYGLNDNVQLDAGCNFGLTRSAPDYNPFAGLSWRF